MAALVALLASPLPAPVAAQQTRDSAATSIAISGTVYDSLSGRPLAEARVQLAASDLRGSVSTARTDSGGNFLFGGVQPGEYLVGFTHPFLDSLGLDVPPLKLKVGGTTPLRLSLAIPTALAVRAQICPATQPADSSGLVLGFLRDADSGLHLDSGRVVLEWTEVRVSKDGKSIVPERRSASAEATGAGWYALCGVPTAGPIAARAEVAGRVTGYIDVTVPPRGVLHRDFNVPTGASAVAVTPANRGDSTNGRDIGKRDTGTSDVTPIRHGRSRVTGVVLDRNGRPLHGARLFVWGSDITTNTDDDGRFTLSGLPAGTQTLEARYIGYAPKRVAVDLASDRTASVSVTLDKIAQVLSEVKVYGEQSALSRRLEGFRQRMRAGWGRFITRADIKQRAPIRLTDLLRGMPGIEVRPKGAFDYELDARNSSCGGVPVYVDGHRLLGVTRGSSRNVNDNDFVSVNDLVWLDWIVGIEVYSDGFSAPAEYGGWGFCPRVLIWTSMDADVLDRAGEGGK